MTIKHLESGTINELALQLGEDVYGANGDPDKPRRVAPSASTSKLESLRPKNDRTIAAVTRRAREQQ
jgi:hypothetical protein